ncbi:hypothetical protein [Streptomyces goshikiensis]|uniref:hypothetical protein n=1 Tax=Streptomyces goshikiensis TaxID=1942 RepID=UPI00364FFDD6
MSGWRLFWVPSGDSTVPPHLTGWQGLPEREAAVGFQPGTPILLMPGYRVDERLALYFIGRPFCGFEPETKRN